MASVAYNLSKNRSFDRIVKLKVKEGEHKLSSKGLVDNRLFTGENKLHAIMDPQTAFWFFRYESGNLPAPLAQKFTTFNKAIDFAQNYFSARNIDIEEVADA